MGRRSLWRVPSDEEFRRVAEDLRGLARSLARDFRAAADQVRRTTNETIRDERDKFREQLRDERQKFREQRREDRRAGRPSWGPYVGPPPPFHGSRTGRPWESKWGTPPLWQPKAPSGTGMATVPAPPAPRPPKVKKQLPPLRHRRDSS